MHNLFLNDREILQDTYKYIIVVYFKQTLYNISTIRLNVYSYVDTNAEPANYKHCVWAIIFPLQEKTRWDLQERLLNHFRDSFNDKIGKFPFIFYE